MADIIGADLRQACVELAQGLLIILTLGLILLLTTIVGAWLGPRLTARSRTTATLRALLRATLKSVSRKD